MMSSFVNIINKYDFDVDLTSGRYVVDAKPHNIQPGFQSPSELKYIQDCESFLKK